MSRHLLHAIDDLKAHVALLGTTVQQAVALAVEAVLDGDTAKAERVTQGDRAIDVAEVALEEECLKVFALYQPVGTDLRLMVGILKLNNDLERIGDLAVSVAGNAGHLDAAGHPELKELLAQLAARSQSMIHLGLDCLMRQDARLALEVCAADDEVDRLYHAVRGSIQEVLATESQLRGIRRVEALLRMVHTARSLERMADHATNIAEDVIYMVTGEIPRHGAIHDLRLSSSGEDDGQPIC